VENHIFIAYFYSILIFCLRKIPGFCLANHDTLTADLITLTSQFDTIKYFYESFDNRFFIFILNISGNSSPWFLHRNFFTSVPVIHTYATISKL